MTRFDMADALAIGADRELLLLLVAGIRQGARCSLYVIVENEVRAGRPRDPDKDDAVRRAVRKLLAERGYQATTIPAVARAAGIGAPTIYRRWATQSAMIESALPHRIEPPSIESAGDFDTYLQSFVAVVVDYFADPVTRAAAPGLLVEYYREPQHYASLVVRIEDPMRKLFRSAHAEAVIEGVVSKTPTADALFDTIVGHALYHGVWRHTAGEQLKEDILEVVRAASRPTVLRSAGSRKRAAT